jgi:hypothetical protein
MDPIQNPYTPGAGAPPPALTGRDAELERFHFLAQRVLAGRPEKSMLVTGLRGVGKTVLLNRFEGIAEEAGFQTAFKETTEDEDFRLVLARMIRRILLGLSSEERVRDRARRALGILRGFSMRLPGGVEVAIDVDAVLGAADSGDLQADFTELFLELGSVARDAGTGVMLFFDEIQYLKSAELAALITATHRVVQRVLPITIVGAGLPQIPTLAGEAKSYAERLFDVPQIGSLTTDAALEAIIRPARELGVEFEPAAGDLIVELTEGYPYFLQEYGKHVWNVAMASPIRVEDVREARPAVQEQLDENFFRVRISRGTTAEKRYMRAMAELGRGPYRSGDIAEKLGRRVTSMGPLRAQLIHKGFIYSPSHGLADFTVPQFDDFMRRNFPFPLD